MIVQVKYFGMIAEKIGLTSESMELNIKGVLNLREYFEEKYPDIGNMNYKIAVNQQISDVVSEKEKELEIALLPPFAGG